MKLTKLILTFFLACSLQPAACSLLLAADLELESDALGQGKLRTDTFTFIEQSDVSDGAAAPSGSEGRIAYSQSDSALCVSDGTTWHVISGASTTIATRIVAAADSLGTTGTAPGLTNPKADLTCQGTNDQATIMSAINALGAGGGAVYLLDGTYSISGPITMQNNIALIGAGASTVLQVAGGSGVNVILASGRNRILISQLKIDGNNKTGSYGIYFNNGTSYSKIDQVWIEQMNLYGMYINSSSNNIFSRNNVQSNNGGITLINSSNNVFSANNVQLNSFLDGFYTSNSSNNLFSANNVQSNGRIGIYLSGASSQNNIISGNNIQLNGGVGVGVLSGILINSSSSNTVSGNNIQGNTFQGINIQGASSQNNIISGNNIQSNTREGIYILSSSNNNTISGNIIYDNGCDGIKMQSNCDNNLVSSNRISKSGAATSYYGINIDANTEENNYIFSNLITGTGFSAEINDAGTATRYTGKDKITLEPVSFAPADAGKIALSTAAGTSPASYIRLNPSVNVTLGDPAIDDGKAAGDVLILENISATKTVTINDNPADTGPNMELTQDHIMGQNDTLKLIWNGSDWIEVSYANN